MNSFIHAALGLFWVSSLALAGEGIKSPGKWVVIGSGEPFSFSIEYEVKLEKYLPRVEGYAEGKLTLSYKEETFILSRKSEDKGSSDLTEVKTSLDQLGGELFSRESIAFALMEKNIAVIDDVAQVLSAHPQVQRFQPVADAASTNRAFRYALMLQVQDGVVLKHQFIRQGKPDEGCSEEQEEPRR